MNSISDLMGREQWAIYRRIQESYPMLFPSSDDTVLAIAEYFDEHPNASTNWEKWSKRYIERNLHVKINDNLQLYGESVGVNI